MPIKLPSLCFPIQKWDLVPYLHLWTVTAIWSQCFFSVKASKKVIKELFLKLSLDSFPSLLNIRPTPFLIFELNPVFLQTNFLLCSCYLPCSLLDLDLSHCGIFPALKSNLLIFVSYSLFLYKFVPIPTPRFVWFGLVWWGTFLGNAIFISYFLWIRSTDDFTMQISEFIKVSLPEL